MKKRNLKIKKICRRNKAVAPVLATLLMIAVAVAMSVIIFMWSQGFLAGTSESTGSQQGSQNQAAQSSIAIETALFTIGCADTEDGTEVNCPAEGTSPKIIVLVRNVGAVSSTLGSITISGINSNNGFSGSITYLWPLEDPTPGDDIDVDPPTGLSSMSDGTWTIAANIDGVDDVTMGKGDGEKIVITETGVELSSDAATHIESGDVISVKVTTSVGTFAQQSFTVP